MLSTELRVLLAAGAGICQFLVKVNGIAAAVTHDVYKFPPPTIVADTLRSPTGAPTTQYTSSTTLGEIMLFNITNGAANYKLMTAWMIFQPSGVNFSCPVQPQTTAKTIYCRVPAGWSLIVYPSHLTR